MIHSNNLFQIWSYKQPNFCIKVCKTLEKVGRLWLRKCKSKGESSIKRQMFGVTNEGKLHPSTIASSIIFLYNNKNLKYQKDCTDIMYNEKNHLMFDLFDGTIFLMGDVTKVMAVQELEEKKEVKLQKSSPTKISKQHWTLHFHSWNYWKWLSRR